MKLSLYWNRINCFTKLDAFKKFYLFFILLTLVSLNARSEKKDKFSQNTQSQVLPNVKISGVLLEKGSRKPISNANIYVLPEGLKATTDKSGAFIFESLPAGFRQWVVTVSGYKNLKLDYKYESSQEGVKLYLERKIYTPFETTVVGKIKKEDPSQKTLKKSEFLVMPGSNGDPIIALENLPGVGLSFDADVTIQGSPPEDTRYLIEGHEIPYIFHFYGLNTVALPESVESVDFLSAGYGAKFGRASSGLVNLNLQKPRTDRSYQMAFVDLTAAGGFAEGPLGQNKSYFVGARYSYVGQIIKLATDALADENDGPPSFNVAPTYMDINFSYHNKLSDRSNLEFTALASRDIVKAVQEDAENLTFSGTIYGKTEFFRLIPKYTYRLSGDSKIETSIAAGIDRQLFTPGIERLNITTTRVSWRAEYEKIFSDTYKLSAGTDFLYDYYKLDARISSALFGDDDSDLPFGLAEILTSNDKSSDFKQGYFVKNRFDLFDKKWGLNVGARLDHFQLHKEFYFQPRLGVDYKITPESNLYFNTGVYYQPETPINLGEGTGNPDLEASKSLHYALRYDQDFRSGSTEGFLLSAGLFYKDLRNLRVQSSSQVTRNNELVPERYKSNGEGSSKGFETLLKYKRERSFVNLGYTYTKSERIGLDGLTYPSLQDQTHNLNISSGYSWGKYVFGARFRYVTGVPYTPNMGGIYYDNADTYIPIPGRRLSERIDDFWQLDLRIDRKWVYEKWILSVYLDLQNITSRKNQTSISYSFDYSESQKSTGLPLFPSFGVKGEF